LLPNTPAPLSGNKAIEDAAIAFVLDLERQSGRNPVDRRYEKAYAADIESLPRVIEVKAVGGSQRGWFLPLEVPQVNEARSNPGFSIYRRQRPAGLSRTLRNKLRNRPWGWSNTKFFPHSAEFAAENERRV